MKNVTYTDKKNRTWNYSIPFEIECTLTHVKKTYTSEEYINNKIERFDGLDNLRATYVCRDAKRANKPIKVVNNPTTELEIKPKSESKSIESLKMEIEKPKPLDKETTDTCHNPGWLLNKKPCKDCAFMSICTYKDSPRGQLLIAKKVKAA